VIEAKLSTPESSLRGDVLSARDRAILDNAAGFFGVHSVVANTIESKANGVTDIDPNTGLPRVEVKRPIFQSIDNPGTGA